MGRRKKAAVEIPPCLHCSKVFQFPVKWCPRCEDHFSLDGWHKNKDVCDRCHAGDNDEYLKRKKALVESAGRAHGVHEAATLVAAYLEWVESPAYADRFNFRMPSCSADHTKFCIHCDHAKAYHGKTCVGWGEKPCKCKGFEPQEPPKEKP